MQTAIPPADDQNLYSIKQSQKIMSNQKKQQALLAQKFQPKNQRIRSNIGTPDTLQAKYSHNSSMKKLNKEYYAN